MEKLYHIDMKDRIKKVTSIIYLILLLVLVSMIFIANHNLPFVYDDEWYATNLVTGKALSGIGDVIQSQIWHYMNWGGRSITHTLLQLIIMLGENVADVLNTAMTLLLAFVICKVANVKGTFSYLLTLSLIITLNPTVLFSMLWQAGCVNYVYSTTWILSFILIYVDELDKKEEIKKWKLILRLIYMPLLGLITGWSNENMGPASFLLSAFIIVRVIYKSKKNGINKSFMNYVWMIEGSVFALVGSMLVILAPGNFVRSEYVEYNGLLNMLLMRTEQMIEATGGYLFYTLLFLVLVILVYTCICKRNISEKNIILLATATLAHFAMVLSPHYPDRAIFGVMCICILVGVNLMYEMRDDFKRLNYLENMFAIIMWMFAIIRL